MSFGVVIGSVNGSVHDFQCFVTPGNKEKITKGLENVNNIKITEVPANDFAEKVKIFIEKFGTENLSPLQIEQEHRLIRQFLCSPKSKMMETIRFDFFRGEDPKKRYTIGITGNEKYELYRDLLKCSKEESMDLKEDEIETYIHRMDKSLKEQEEAIRKLGQNNLPKTKVWVSVTDSFRSDKPFKTSFKTNHSFTKFLEKNGNKCVNLMLNPAIIQEFALAPSISEVKMATNFGGIILLHTLSSDDKK